jgi:hypothetical protein
MADTKISALTAASVPLAGTEVLPIVQSGTTVKVTVDNLTKGRLVNATTFDTDVAAAGVTLSGTSLIADGTDANIDINITPKGTGAVVVSKLSVDNITIDGNTISSTNANGDVIIDPQRALLVDTATRQSNAIAQVRDLVIVPTNNGDYFQQFDIAKGAINGLVDATAFNLFTASTPLAYGFPQGCAFAGQLFVAVQYMDNQGGQRSHQLIYDVGLGGTNGTNLTWQFDQVRDYVVQNGGGSAGSAALSAVTVSATSATLAITVTGGTYPVNSGGPNQITARLIGTATSSDVDRKLSIVPA